MLVLSCREGRCCWWLTAGLSSQSTAPSPALGCARTSWTETISTSLQCQTERSAHLSIEQYTHPHRTTSCTLKMCHGRARQYQARMHTRQWVHKPIYRLHSCRVVASTSSGKWRLRCSMQTASLQQRTTSLLQAFRSAASAA